MFVYNNKLTFTSGVGIRVFQDMSTATVLFDTVYNSVPEVKLSGKKVRVTVWACSQANWSY